MAGEGREGVGLELGLGELSYNIQLATNVLYTSTYNIYNKLYNIWIWYLVFYNVWAKM